MYGTNKRPIIESFKAGSGHLIDRAMTSHKSVSYNDQGQYLQSSGE